VSHPLPTLLWLLTAAVSLSACGRAPNTAAGQFTAPLSWSDVASLAAPRPGVVIPYGSAPQQFGELRVPAGAGPFPVAVLIHGGCWKRAFDYRYFAHLADRLTRDTGVATWLIEYRRLGDPGGGWPGTFLDAAAATDFVRQLARTYPLDPSRTIAVGHSAGGHLALWLAARSHLPTGSDLHTADPLSIRAVVGLAPIADLPAYLGADAGGCSRAVSSLMGGSPKQQPSRYRAGSPAALLPLRVPQWFVQGVEDPIVPVGLVRDYVAKARQSGDRVEMLDLAEAEHFDPAVPDSMAWPQTLSVVRLALRD